MEPRVRALLGTDAERWSIKDLGTYRLKGVVEPEHLYQLDAPGLPTRFPPLRGESDAADHLPKRMTTFIGREAELVTLESLLDSSRLLTLTGPGGTGKSTLAVELARRRAGDFADGAWFVDLQALDDPNEVKREIAYGLGLFDGSTGTAADRLLGYVAERDLLIVVDNFEQVADAAGVIPGILESSLSSKVLVTSRIPLRLSMEQEYGVQPLQTEGDEAERSEAVRLFVDRARKTRPGLEVGEDDVETIRATCRMLDGLPLAIELCAARTSALPLQVIHDRLQEKLPLPDTALRDLPERQRTIESTVAWSYDLLEPPVQRLFVRLGVFAGSFDLEQAEEVCGPTDALGIDVLSGLFQLVEHSLVFRVDDQAGGIRFDMLEAMRAFAAARLDTSDDRAALALRHAAAYVNLAGRCGGRVFGNEAGTTFDRLVPDGPNLIAAARCAIEAGDVELALRAVGSLWRFLIQSGRMAECRELVDAALAMPGADAPTEARVQALDAWGAILYWADGMASAMSVYEEQLALATVLGDESGRALALLNTATVLGFTGDPAGAMKALDDARMSYQARGDDHGLQTAEEYEVVARFYGALSDPEGHREMFAEVTARYVDSKHLRLRKLGLSARAWLALMDGRIADAAHDSAASMRINLATRETTTAVADIALTPWVLLAVGRPQEAVTVMTALQSAIDRLGIRIPLEHDRTFEAMVSTLAGTDHDAAVRRGRTMSLDALADFMDELADTAVVAGGDVTLAFPPGFGEPLPAAG